MRDAVILATLRSYMSPGDETPAIGAYPFYSYSTFTSGQNRCTGGQLKYILRVMLAPALRVDMM